MMTIFLIPLSIIALYESHGDTAKNGWLRGWLHGNDEGEADVTANRDPEVDGELQITKVPFDELVKKFPNTTQVGSVAFFICSLLGGRVDLSTSTLQSSETTILHEIRDLKRQLDMLTKTLEELRK
jgi:hypothetical protein